MVDCPVALHLDYLVGLNVSKIQTKCLLMELHLFCHNKAMFILAFYCVVNTVRPKYSDYLELTLWVAALAYITRLHSTQTTSLPQQDKLNPNSSWGFSRTANVFFEGKVRQTEAMCLFNPFIFYVKKNTYSTKKRQFACL